MKKQLIRSSAAILAIVLLLSQVLPTVATALEVPPQVTVVQEESAPSPEVPDVGDTPDDGQPPEDGEIPDDGQLPDDGQSTDNNAPADETGETTSEPADMVRELPAEDPVPYHYYTFDDAEAATIVDYGSGKVDGTKNSLTFTDGRKDKAGEFGSGEKYVAITDTAFVDKSKESYTVSAWINWNGTLTQGNSILRGESGNTWFHIRKDDSGNSRKLWFDYNGGSVNSGSTLVPTGEWTHVAITSDKTAGTKLYMNGKLLGENETPAVWQTKDATFKIGRENWHPFHGLIDEYKMFDVALTDQQIADMAGISTIAPEEIEILTKNWGTQDVELTMSLCADDSLKKIECNSAALVPDTDYTVTATTVTINASYLETNKDADMLTLTFTFAGGATDSVKLIQTTPPSTIDPSEMEIAAKNWGTTPVVLTMSLYEDDTLEKIEFNNVALLENTDYTTTATTVTINASYLAANQEADVLSLTFTFAGGATDSVTLIQIKPYEQVEYTRDFATDGIDGLTKLSGSGSFELEDGALRIKGETMLIDTKSLVLKDGEVEFTLEPMNDRGGFGLVFRGTDGMWSGFQCVDTRRSDFVYAGWNLKTNGGVDDMIWDDTTLPMSMREYKFKLRFQGNVCTFYVDGQEAYTFESSKLSQAAGKVGIMTLGQTDVKISNLSCRSLQPLMPVEESAQVSDVTLTSDVMTIKLDGTFPRVLEYNYGGKLMYGQLEPKYYAMVNSVNYPATAVAGTPTETSVTYRVTVPAVSVAFDTTYTIDGGSLKMEITNIDETNTTVYTLGFPENCILSLKSTQPDAELDAAVPWKPLNQSEVDDVTDYHRALNTAIDGNAYKYANIPVFSTNELSASMVNTLVKNLQEFAFKSFTAADGTLYTGVWNTEFVYRGWGFDENGVDGGTVDDLSCTVVLTEDANGDSTVDWQDGALALNTVRDLLPGAEKLQDSFAHIAMNFASGAQEPFLRIGDNLKKFYMVSDGFGQMLEIKGYNSEGHDSGHSEASDVNTRAGGAEDYQTLAADAKKYNAYVGGHVNVSNMFPEAATWDPKYAGADNHTWGGWLDDGCDMKRENFISDGVMDDQFDTLAEAVPDIGMVYLDTFVDYRFSSYRIGENFKSHGWAVWNENRAMLDKYSIWAHWPGVSSTIHRFVHQQDKDVYGYNSILRGGSRTNGFMSWQHTQNFNDVVSNFYTGQLPYRYLMNHELLKLTDTEGTFSNNVRSTSDKKIYKDDKLIANDNLIFIPWSPETEEKIYHWNPSGGETTWDLPDSWAGQTTVKLYRMTYTGKDAGTDLTVEGDKVTIDAQKNTPYVLYKSDYGKASVPVVAVTEWSVGSPVKDASFISHSFTNWTKAPTEAANITIEHTGFEKCYLAINGAEGGAVTQEITLVPGQKYEISVWAEVGNGKQAFIEVALPGGAVVSNHMDASPLNNNDYNAAMRNTHFLRMGVTFTMPAGDATTATLTLKGLGGEETGYARFTDVRAVKTARLDLAEAYLLNEDFENVSEGYGPFFPTGSNVEKIHLSEANKGYTNDTLEGHYSLKCKDYGLRTLPFTLRFEPNRKYFIDFLSSGGGTIKVLNEAGDSVVLNESIAEGENSFSFITGAGSDYYIRLDNPQILDNIEIYRVTDPTPPSTPENLAAALDANGTWVNLNWGASTDLDSGVSSYQIYRNTVLLTTVGNVTTYTDKATDDETEYTYQVTAVNDGDTPSAKSTKVSITTLVLQPAVESAVLNGTKAATVTFNKAMDKASAETTANYPIVGETAVTVTAAVLAEDSQTVTLTLSGMTVSDSITLQVKNVKDASGKHPVTGEETFVLSMLSHLYKFDEAEGTAVVDSAGSKNGIKDNAVTSVDGKLGKAAYFDSKGWVDLDADILAGQEEYTLATWISWSGKGTNSETIFSSSSSGNAASPGVWLRLNSGTITADNLAGGSVNSGDKKVAANTWAHIAVIRRTGGTDLYMNGELVGTTTATIRLGNNGTHIGANSDNKSPIWKGHNFDGAIDEFMIFNAALASDDIAALAGLHTVTVNGGTGSGKYAEGKSVTATAEVPEGKRFVNWTAVGVTPEDLTQPTITFAMPDLDVTLTANFEKIPASGVTLDKNALPLFSNTDSKTATLVATVAPADAFDKSVAWTSSDDAVATVDQNGLVTALSNGTATITVTTTDGNHTATCAVTVSTYTPPYTPPSNPTKPPVTVENPDGSKTTTETDKKTGTITETTEFPDGKEVKTITAKDGGKTLAVTDKDGNKAAEIKLPAEIPAPEIPFTDVPEDHWAKAAVDLVTGLKLFSGSGNGTFSGEVYMTRGMLTTVLHRLSGEVPGGENAFTDVAEGAWYADSVAWASKNGIVTGSGAGFDPNGDITRESLAAMLCRYAALLGMDTTAQSDMADFSDSANVSGWAEASMKWAVQTGIITGKSGSRLDPSGNASRNEVAVMLQRFVLLLK